MRRLRGALTPLTHRPSKFPIRSVLALRVALIEPAVIPAVYTAAWVDDVDIADEGALADVLLRAGFDNAADLIRQTNDEAVKEQLKRTTQRAVDAGACGVPSFQVDGGALIWGQDRLNVVEDLVNGWVDPTAEALPAAKL